MSIAGIESEGISSNVSYEAPAISIHFSVIQMLLSAQSFSNLYSDFSTTASSFRGFRFPRSNDLESS
jgi:hypothetical protein